MIMVNNVGGLVPATMSDQPISVTHRRSETRRECQRLLPCGRGVRGEAAPVWTPLPARFGGLSEEVPVRDIPSNGIMFDQKSSQSQGPPAM